MAYYIINIGSNLGDRRLNLSRAMRAVGMEFGDFEMSHTCLLYTSGLSGWFSTNILGNRDGLVLDEPANFRTKEVSKLSTLESILVPEDQPDLYGHGNDEDTQYYHLSLIHI